MTKKTAPYTLVVVDMQPSFKSSQNKLTIYAVSLLIEKAIQDGADIVVLEYAGYGSTDWRIRDEYAGYDRVFTITKYADDGSNDMIESSFDFQKERFVICGVNTPFCVSGTALGLREKFPKSDIEVKLNACNQYPYHGVYCTEAIAEWHRNNVLATY